MSIPASAMCPAVSQVLETMYFLDPAYKGAGNPAAPVIGANLRFGGAFEGQFRVAVNGDLAARMTAEFLVADASDVSEEQTQAAVRELTNVACGAALSNWMPDADFRFAIPSMLPENEASAIFTHCFSVDGGAIDIAFDLLID